jgi:hypothetical protein
MEPLPLIHAQLARWYPRLTDRVRALGFSRQTLTTWERNPDAARLRAGAARRIRQIASVTADVERLVGSADGAGAWMCAPQPLAGGQIPAALAREGRFVELRRLIFPDPPSTPVRRIEMTDADRRRPSFPTLVRRERPRSASEARLLERLGEDPMLIGPVGD